MIWESALTCTYTLPRVKPGFPGGTSGKESPANVGELGWEIPWSWKWQPTPVFLPGKSHGQRSLVGYSPWGHKGLDTTDCTHTHTHTHTHKTPLLHLCPPGMFF